MSDKMKECLIIPDKTDDYKMKVRRVFNYKNEMLSFDKLRELAARDYSKDTARFIKPRRPNTTGLWWASMPNWGPLWILKIVLNKFEDTVFWASMKFATMMILMPLWWIGGFTVAFLLRGFWEGIVVVFLSILGLFIRGELRKKL